MLSTVSQDNTENHKGAYYGKFIRPKRPITRTNRRAKYTIDDLKDTGKKIRKTAPIESLAAVNK
ncbi:hypothetical protein ACVFZR_05515, partial [Lacticaseibacillus paracasei]